MEAKAKSEPSTNESKGEEGGGPLPPTSTHCTAKSTPEGLLPQQTPFRLRLPSISSEKTKNATKKLKRRVININRETLPLKINLFLFYGGMSAILPYLTIHMKDIGISIQEVAVIYAVLPFTTFIGPPLMGFLADKWGQYKPVLVLATIGCSLFHTLLLFVPIYRDVRIPGHTLLQWDPFTNQTLLLPGGSDALCGPFNEHHSSAHNFTIHSLTDCEKLVKGEGQEQGRSQFHEYKHEEEEGEEEIGLLELIEDVSGAELKEDEGQGWDAENDELHLKIEGRSNCSIRVSNRYLRLRSAGAGVGVGRNVSSVRCTTNLDFESGMREVKGHQPTTFWVYFAIRIVANILASCCFTLLDATTLAVVKASGTAEYGRERMWSILGLAIMSPIAGVLVDQISRQRHFTDYSPAFYLSNILLLINSGAYFCMQLKVEKPEKGFLKNGGKLLRYPEVVTFLIMVFILGSLWGFVESYLFIFLKELNAPNYLLGLTLTIGSLTGLPFLWGAESIVSKIGRVNLLVIAFLTYFVRYFGYSYITNPFWCFPFEAMEALTYHLMWTSAATYCAVLAPTGLLATLTGIVGSLHYSLGKGNGSFIGGYMFGEIGARLTFRWFGIAAGIFGIVFFLIDFFWMRGIVERRLAKKQKNEVKGQEREGEKELTPIAEAEVNVEVSKRKGDEEDDDEDEEVTEAMLTHALPQKETSHNLY